MNLSKRIISIDVLKSISIFGVVFIHARNGNIITEYISELFRVAVPVFVIFFAYFLDKSLSKSTSKNEYFSILKNRFKVLFMPYLLFTVLYFFMLNDLATIHLHDLITGYWSGYGWPGQYFFIILFQLIFLFPLIQKMATWHKNVILLFFVLSIFTYFLLSYFLWGISVFSLISDRLFIYWIPFALFGIILHRNKAITNVASKINIVLFSLILIPFEFILLNQLQLTHSPYIIPSVLVASLLMANYFVDQQESIERVMASQLKNVSIYISQRSLGIFVLNPFVIYLLKKIPVVNIHVNNVFLEAFINITFAIVSFGGALLMVALLENTFLKRVVVN